MQRLRISAVPAVLVVLLALLLSPSNATFALQTSLPTRSLTLVERVQCQQAIEQVYWDYRIWLPENKTPKPALETMLTPDVLQARVEDTARQSNLLATYWNTPVTGAMVQAEMARMARETRQPEQLRALLTALGNDPTLVAECLARPALVERLVRAWYAQDDRLHGDLATRAADDLARMSDPSDLLTTTGEYQETTWRLTDSAITDPSGAMMLDESEWATQRESLAGWFGTSVETIPTGRVSLLQEDEKGYFAVAVLSQSETDMNIVTVRWQKESFDTWWAREKARFNTTIDPLDYAYTLPPVKGTSETPSMGDSGWVPTPSLPIRTNVTAVWTGSEMIVFGGGSLGTGRSNDGWRYNPATDTWLTIVSINAPMERFGHTAIWSGTEMIVWGGCGPFQYAFCELASGGRYNPVTGVWTATSGTNAPAARFAHTAVWTGSEMIVWGGCAPNTNGSSCVEKDTGGRYNPVTDTWVATSLMNVPLARVGHTAVWTGEEMIIWGGEDGLTALNTGGRYDPDTNTWVATNSATAPSARAIHTAVWTGTEMIVWGGCPDVAGCIVQGTPFNTGGRYNPTTDSWTATNTTNAPTARAAHTAVWTGTEMIVWGGGTSTNIFFNTGGRYTPATDSWMATNTTNAPAARFGHVAVWTGDLMVVWGGSSRTGGRYSPATNSWTPTSDEDPNSIRSNHVAVWTGVEMIVWGGDDVPNGTVDTGRIYTPATRTWRDTPPSNLGGRHSLAAVWTGTEMIVWGGQVGNYIYDTGGRFNPTTNTWTPMTTTNAPEARAWHVAAWSGSEMIIWGGNGETAYMNTGGRYNPLTNTWTVTSLTNAPSGRYLHAGVWDGDELIVWGGLESIGDTSTGGRYNPVTNIWQATSLTNAPSARHFHSATWTGEEMIVWGGVTDLSNPTNFNTGGQYDPDSDSWQATSTTNAPAGRVRHTAIWTGAELIVWGGCPGLYCVSGDAFYDGGHYDPIADTWTPTAIDTGIPRARGEHTAVWTGDRMIVWGGYTDLSTYSNTGAEYFTDSPPPTPTPTPSATGVPPTATATGVPPTLTPTSTGVPSTPTATPTTFPGTLTPTPTGAPPTLTPSTTSVPGTPTATTVPATPTATTTPQHYRLFMPVIEG
jgi:N-acetylneuraminic acid mutarotase